MRTLAVVALLAVLVAPACRGGPDRIRRDPFYANPSVAPREAHAEMLAVESADVAAQFAEATLVFTAEVLEVGKSSGVGSGVLMVTQPVAYRVTRVLRGPAVADRIVVHHVIAGGATQDPFVANRLNPTIWREGARLLVWAKRADDGRLVSPWETPGPLKAEGHAATRVRTMLE